MIRLDHRRTGAGPGDPAPPVGGSAAYQPGTSSEPDQSLARLAATVEALFKARGRTLTDKAAAESYDITLNAVGLMLAGALAEGMLTEQTHAKLAGMIEGMRSAPEHL
ncbi:hypothetical protein AB0933_32600 [Streptomyces venezuelae]|uniref:hypothetical protein n=1 Tax=Streptomyces venezuelae TaxID=54571 RepID=UPI003456046D